MQGDLGLNWAPHSNTTVNIRLRTCVTIVSISWGHWPKWATRAADISIIVVSRWYGLGPAVKSQTVDIQARSTGKLQSLLCRLAIISSTLFLMLRASLFGTKRKYSHLKPSIVVIFDLRMYLWYLIFIH